ncbi:hypothetical protein TREES_T100007764 [Tupaia chinensis]|uniref:Uncharacterized protein n=1 Tax=Tupaia chinensis TaxID=246437 RepID=L9KIR8_TUPCH|nr:hypothetical protein TREES_T100007764 [Tupaia chinensis]
MTVTLAAWSEPEGTAWLGNGPDQSRAEGSSCVGTALHGSCTDGSCTGKRPVVSGDAARGQKRPSDEGQPQDTLGNPGRGKNRKLSADLRVGTRAPLFPGEKALNHDPAEGATVRIC